MLQGIESLQKELRPEHLPPLLSESDKTKLLARLSALEIPKKTEGDAFDLSVTEQRLVLGRGLLDALRKVKETEVIRIGQSLLLHELFHFDQNLQSTTYIGIGRAGFALEEVDYWADTFALATLTRWEILREGEKGQKPERVRAIVTEHIDAALSGMPAELRSGGARRRSPHLRPQRPFRRDANRARPPPPGPRPLGPLTPRPTCSSPSPGGKPPLCCSWTPPSLSESS